MLNYEIITLATSWTLLISIFFYRDMLSATQLAMNAKNLVDVADHVLNTLSSTSVVLLSLRIILTRSDRNSPSSWLCPPLMKSLNPLRLLFFLPFVSAEIQKSWINLVLTFDSFSSENFFSTEQFNPLFTSIIYCLYIILSFTLCFNRSTTQWFNTWRRGKLTWYNLVDLISRICHMR